MCCIMWRRAHHHPLMQYTAPRARPTLSCNVFTFVVACNSISLRSLSTSNRQCLTTGPTLCAPASGTSQHVSCAFFSFFFASSCSPGPLVHMFLSFAGIITYIVPCYTFGKNAEQLGESCIMYALSQFVPILDIWCRTSVRGKIREQKGIEGTCMKDCLMHWFCGLCALVQEARVSANKYGMFRAFFSNLFSHCRS